jgi:uncharacterized protein YraI
MNLRAGPGTNHPTIGTVAAGTTLILEARNAAATWVLAHTADNASRGWLSAGYLTFGAGVSVGALPVSDELMQSQDYDTIDRVFGLPAVGVMTGRAWEIYTQGQQMGNDPNRFSKVGDCQSVTPFFLADFDADTYDLGDYGALQSTIDYFTGSWGRDSKAVDGGYTIASILNPRWAQAGCRAGESPQQCEYREWQPAFVLISLEMWRGSTAATYENYLRTILDFWIENGVVPIVATKSNNTEGDWSVNIAIARVVWEYNLPFWNVLAATATLPDNGLTDGFHLTFGPNDFSDPDNLQQGWTQRNLTALQTLDSMRRAIGG